MGLVSVGPSIPPRGRLFEEFLELLTVGNWTSLLGGGASAFNLNSILHADYDEGIGILRLNCANALDSALVTWSSPGSIPLREGLPVRFEALVRVSSVLDIVARFGLGIEGQGTTLLVLETGAANWGLRTQSATGGGSALLDTGVPVVIDTYHRILLELVPGVSVTASLNGAQIAQVTTATQIAQAGDAADPYLKSTFVAQAGGTADIDFVDVRVG